MELNVFPVGFEIARFRAIRFCNKIEIDFSKKIHSAPFFLPAFKWMSFYQTNYTNYNIGFIG